MEKNHQNIRRTVSFNTERIPSSETGLIAVFELLFDKKQRFDANPSMYQNNIFKPSQLAFLRFRP
jgi:hypothetical protein